LKKDPGIPNLFPFKEKLLHQIAEQKAAQMAEKLTEKTRLKNMLRNAQKRGDEFESEQVEAIGEMEEVSTSGRKDDSRKAYYKEFKKVVEQADVILQVLDVRDPLGCRSKQIEEMILNAGAGKRIILVLNKIGMFVMQREKERGESARLSRRLTLLQILSQERSSSNG